MNIIKANDLKYGHSMEQKAQPSLETFFGSLYNNNDHNRFHPIDFKNEQFGVEYKRRRITFGQYPTLMVNISKIHKGLEYKQRGMRVFYTWQCDDDWYYWELSDDYVKGTGGTNRRGKDEFVDVAHIKISDINKLSTLVLNAER